jgi:hypothetical protein
MVSWHSGGNLVQFCIQRDILHVTPRILEAFARFDSLPSREAPGARRCRASSPLHSDRTTRLGVDLEIRYRRSTQGSAGTMTKSILAMSTWSAT